GALELYQGETLLPPGVLRTGTGRPYSVFSQFARAFLGAAVIGEPLPAPRRLPPLPRGVEARTAPVPTCEALGLPRHPAILPGGERAARARLRRFLRTAAPGYALDRDRLDIPGTSRLSADLKFGTLSAREVWTAVEGALGGTGAARAFLN